MTLAGSSFLTNSHAIAVLVDARERARRGQDTAAEQEEAIAFIVSGRDGFDARVERLQHAIEGELDGLAVDDGTARAILGYVEAAA